MGYVLLAPEMVIMWAGRQHFAARNFARKHQENKGWTRAHAFFLIMGGFTLHEGGKPVRVLEARELEELSEAGRIEWPKITEEEIADRSKGDYLSKAIVLFQATWFIGQCIARGAYKLAVTELEVVTLAFAILTGVIYYFWWDKPLDVRCSIPVQLLEGCVRKEDTRSQIIPPPGVSSQAKEEDEEITVLLPSSQIQVDKSTPDPTLTNIGPHIVPSQEVSDQGMPQGDEKVEVVINADPPSSTSIQVNSSSPNPVLTRMERFQAFRRRSRKKHGTLLGSGYVFIVFPFMRFVGGFADMGNCDTLGDKILRVPTFYSPPDEDSGAAVIQSMCVSIVFGAVHCIAWSLHFATLSERWAWRISAILVAGLPIAITTFLIPIVIFEKEIKGTGMKILETFLKVILMSMLSLYIIARIALLVLPFMALRALPPGAYVQLDWVSFLPHI
jgi:hypothetical protein